MKTRQFLITLLIVFSAISSSFSQTKRFINEQYIFNANPKSAGYDFKALDSITASDTLALINNSVLGGKWVRGRNLPVKDVTINNYSHNGTLSSYLQGIDLALGAIQETTAGVLTRIYFTGDETTITSGTYYLSNVTGKGTVSDVVQTVSNGDNTKTFFSQDVISSASLLTSTAKKGSYTSSLSVSTESAGNGNDYSQRFTIEIYLTDNDGVPINSGVTGAPVGDLGVTVLTILDSGVLNMPYDAITNITLTGNLNEDVTLLAGNRIRYHISAEKIGTSGGAIDQSLYLGSDHNSYYDVPTPILWGDIEGVLSNQVDLQNALDGKANVGDAYTKTESDGRYLNKNTGGTITGDLTANNFIGNGSQLTGVDATKLGGQSASYYNFRNYGLGTQAIVSTNWDTISESGIYTGVFNVTTGMPVNAGEMSLFHIQTSANSFSQTCIRVSTGETWVRNQFSGTLGNWQKVFITSLSNTITGTTLYNKTIAEIDAAGSKSLVTKEWVEGNSGGGLPVGFYEEGTFTPVLVDGSGGATYTVGTTSANFVRTGNKVFFEIFFDSINTSGTPVGVLKVNNLPFVQEHVIRAVYNVEIQDSNKNFHSISANASGSNSIHIKYGTGGDLNTFQFSGIDFINGELKISGTYITNVYTP